MVHRRRLDIEQNDERLPHDRYTSASMEAFDRRHFHIPWRMPTATAFLCMRNLSETTHVRIRDGFRDISALQVLGLGFGILLGQQRSASCIISDEQIR